MGCNSYVFTLVHGTFARRAEWIEPSASFAGRLRERLGQDIVIQPFRWTGGNSHSARLRAAGELLAHLEELREEHPLASHFVIAHSHGGTVANYALRGLVTRDDLQGVVYLATPFLRVVPRGDRFETATMIFLLILVFGLSTLPGAVWLDPAMVSLKVSTAVRGITVSGITVILFACLAYLVGKVYFDVAERAEPRARELSTDPASAPGHALVVRIEDDEAAHWLRAVLLTTALPDRVFSLLEWALYHLGRVFLWTWGIGLALMLPLAILEKTSGRQSVVLRVGWISVAVCLLAVPAVLALFLPILAGCWLLGVLSRGSTLAFGESALDSLLVRVTVHDGGALVLPPREGSAGGLRHSQVYQHPDVDAVIADWVVNVGT